MKRGIDRYEAAIPAYEKWQERQDRKEHPQGKFDKGGRFYPSNEERQPCCSKIRGPSKRFPYSYMTHCRSAEHVANLLGVEPKLLRGLIAYSAYLVRPVKGVPDFCPVCGADWGCEHQPAPLTESDRAGLERIMPYQADMSKHNI